MKIILLGYSKTAGGAGVAAQRIADCLKKNKINIKEIFLEDFIKKNFFFKLIYFFISFLSKCIKKLQITKNLNSHSLGLFGFFSANTINNISGSILNLLWTNNEVISLKEISKVKKPRIIWTIFDTWIFSGMEHYTNKKRYLRGYIAENKPNDQKGFDINRIVWGIKKKLLSKDIRIIATSNWLYKSISKSVIFKNNKIYKIYCPIDCNIWKPINKNLARKKIGLELDCNVIIYGGGLSRFRKGFDLLEKSLSLELRLKKKLIVLVLGTEMEQHTNSQGVTFKYIKYKESISEQILYHSAADIVAVPSRFDNMPYFGIESMACKNPLITFDIGGCSEMVDHKKSGWVSKPFDINNFTKGIHWILSDSKRHKELSENARNFVIRKFNYKDFINKYRTVVND